MATDLSSITEKFENGGTDESGVLTADEFNLLLKAIKENQGGIKKIIRNNVEYVPDANGTVKMTILRTATCRLSVFRRLTAARPSYPPTALSNYI